MTATAKRKPRDDNQRAIDGDLPLDPSEDTVLVDLDALEREIEQEAPSGAQISALERNDEGLPRVQRGQDVHRVLEDLDRALADENTGDRRLYQRHGELVISRGITAEDARRLKIVFAPESIVIAPLKPASLLPRITEHVDFGYWGFDEKKLPDGTTKRGRVWKRDMPSATLLAAFLSKAFWAHIRPLRGIAVTPIIHLDGSIVESGWDPKSHYFVASNVSLDEIPEEPTEKDAQQALADIFEPFDEFPFETDAERFAPVALVLTLLLRPVIGGNVPAFVQSAPQKNCGKSLATKAACLLATGHVPAANTWAKTEEEQEKMIGAAADAGALVVFFDNISEGAVIGGAPLDKVLTCDGQTGFRVLGLSQLKHLPWNATIAFTANRARIGGDSDRRLLQAQIIRRDAPIQHRHEQLLTYVAKERDRLLVAAFTLIRAWIVADKPRADIRRLDSFEEWAWTVASMIRWAGGGNVRELVRDETGTDRDATEFQLLSSLYDYLQRRGKEDVTVKALVGDVFAGSEYPALREAIEAIGGFEGKGENRKLDVRRFGKRLAAMKDVLQGGYRLKSAGGGHGGTTKWTVSRVGSVGSVGSTALARARETQENMDGVTGVKQPSQATQPTQTGWDDFEERDCE